MTTAEVHSQIDGDRIAKRNAFILASAQAVGGASAPIAISLGGLTGYYLLGDDKSLATLPVTCFVLGTAIATIPAAGLAKRYGRRPAYMLGTVISMIAGTLAAYAIFQADFTLFCLAMMFSGSTNAFVQQYRFAVADTASESLRPKVISWVMAGGILTGIIGPQTAIQTKDLFDPIPFAGAFIAQIGLAVIALGILSFLLVPKMTGAQISGPSRKLSEIVRQPRFVVAVACAICSYALMSLVMTAAPLAMVAHDHSQADAAWGIQWHVIAMFGPSFFTGNLISRYGAERIVAIGMVLLAICGVVALSGIGITNFWGALILLGFGWNFGFIGATTMVTTTYKPAEQSKVQATNDFLVFGFVALASFSSGSILNAFGWAAVNYAVFPIVVLCLALLGWLTLSGRSGRTT